MILLPRIENKLKVKPKQLLLFKNKCEHCKGTGTYTYQNFRFVLTKVKCPICKGAGFKY